MRKYTILHAPLLSFFSKWLYQDVAREWRGTGLLYLLALLAATWVPLVVGIHVVVTHFVRREAPPVVEQVPPITIRDGAVSCPEPQPYFIKDPDTGRPVAIIDTTGELTSLEGTGAGLLLTRTRLIVAQSGNETRIYDLSNTRAFYIDRDILTKWLEIARRWLAVAAYPLLVLFSYVYRIVQALLYAAIGLLFARMTRATLTYQALVRLAIVATTPVIILDTIVLLAGLSIPYWWPICFVIAMGYLYFGVKASAEPVAPQIADSPDVPSFTTP